MRVPSGEMRGWVFEGFPSSTSRGMSGGKSARTDGAAASVRVRARMKRETKGRRFMGRDLRGGMRVRVRRAAVGILAEGDQSRHQRQRFEPTRGVIAPLHNLSCADSTRGYTLPTVGGGGAGPSSHPEAGEP